MADGKSYERAKVMRSALTPPEARLWLALRGKALEVRFRRQHPIGPYILDFYCPSAKLAIEVDGSTHEADAQSAHDRRRTEWLAEKGVRVVRIPAEDVRANLPEVLEWLWREVHVP